MNRIILILILLSLTSCVTQNNQVASIVDRFKLNQSITTGLKYQHLLISNNLAGDTLHIYIEGDGIPWINAHTISLDPTPKNPLALKLMSQDSNFALYVGRPCYFGLHQSISCSIQQWTNGRYSEDVLQSMQAIILSYIRSQQIQKIILIGYSGGGVLASLLAERIPQTQFFVTIAANLDIDQWTSYHNYSPLNLSLNPARQPNAINKLGIHLAGGNDNNVPVVLNSQFIKNSGGKLILYPSYDHLCCWQENWNTTITNLTNNYNN